MQTRSTRLDYDGTYQQALNSADPLTWIENKWGKAEPYVRQFLKPYLCQDMNILEIGAGLGRYTQWLLPYCSALFLVEPSQLCRQFLMKHFETARVLQPMDITSQVEPNSLHLVCSFSTMLHFNLYEIWWYFRIIDEKLSMGAKVIIHYASLEEGGWEVFAKAKCFNFGDVGRYSFHHASQLRKLGQILGWDMVSDQGPRQSIVPGHRVITFERGK